MRVAEGAPAFFRGMVRVPAEGLVTKSMGYLRDEIGPGEPLPGIAPGGLPDALDSCDEVVLSFDGKLGDTLLAFGAVAAVLRYLELVRPDRLPVIRARGPHATMIDQLSLLEGFDVRRGTTVPAAARTVLIGDRQGLNSSQGAFGRVLTVLDCDSEDPPCWSSGPFAYPFLPGRYFIAVERQLGVRLADQGTFMPTLHTEGSEWPRERNALTVRIVTATAPDDPAAEVPYEVLAGTHYSLAGDYLAACNLVIGNDTGLTHLAAATRLPDGSGPQVIGLHARHSHAKWRTGLGWHHALATPFSEFMHREDLCPVRDRIDDRTFGAAADIGAIQTSSLVEAARAVLTPTVEVGQ